MPRVEAKGKRGKPPAGKSRARKPAPGKRTGSNTADQPAAQPSLAPSVLLDAVILFSLAGALFTGVAVYYRALSWTAGNFVYNLLHKSIGLGMYLVPVILLLIPFFAWPSRLRAMWLRSWGWVWCLMLLASLGGGLFIDRGWGGIAGDSVATVGYHYLGWFYPVLLCVLTLIVLARMAGRSFIHMLGWGAYRAAVKTGAAVVDYSNHVREEAAEISAERHERRERNADKKARRESQRRARREQILAAELEAADAPEGDSPLIRAVNGLKAMVVPVRHAQDTGTAAAPRPVAEEITATPVGPEPPAVSGVSALELPADAEPDAGMLAEAVETGSPEFAAELGGNAVQPSVADEEFAAVVAAAGRVPLAIPPAQPGADAAAGDDDESSFGEDRDGQLTLFESTQIGYELPSHTLLRTAPAQVGEEQHLELRARIIENTLSNFKVDATCINSVVGPRVTRYELKIGPGINVSKIYGLADNLALELAVKAVRIEAPIPGKSAVGIEVPNAAPQLVTLRSIVESPLNQQANHPLTVGLGRDIAGNPVVANLAKMPHLLVAGATGSGKSVCLNALIISLLLRNAPDSLRLILIDPKRVEMTSYQDVPHLACPVVHDVNEAQSALKWVVAEMDRRYRVLEKARARNIGAFNGQARPSEQLPYIVVIIDELADLMMLAGQVIEKLICRIAQLSRAVGIHLVIATQRPDVKVITGTIKANVPSRIAFAVVSHIDSRTILDGSGADKLLGSGDMLFAPIGENVPLRVQGAFVADDEIDCVVEWCRGQAAAAYDESITQFELEEDHGAGGPDGGDRDEFFPQAKDIVRDTGRASTSFLQRRLKIGYNRAARIMEELEMAGIVSEPDHTGNRKVL